MQSAADIAFLEEAPDTIGIAGCMDIYRASKLRDYLVEKLELRPKLLIDLAAVQSCDAAGLQILVSARKTADQSGKVLLITNPSEPVQAAANAIGLDMSDLKAARHAA